MLGCANVSPAMLDSSSPGTDYRIDFGNLQPRTYTFLKYFHKFSVELAGLQAQFEKLQDITNQLAGIPKVSPKLDVIDDNVDINENLDVTFGVFDENPKTIESYYVDAGLVIYDEYYDVDDHDPVLREVALNLDYICNKQINNKSCDELQKMFNLIVSEEESQGVEDNQEAEPSLVVIDNDIPAEVSTNAIAGINNFDSLHMKLSIQHNQETVTFQAATNQADLLMISGKVLNKWLTKSSHSAIAQLFSIQSQHSVHVLVGIVLKADDYPNYTYKDGLLRYKGKAVVGQEAVVRQKLLVALHDSSIRGHSGITATYHNLKSLFYWKGMKADVAEFVNSCMGCQRSKHELVASPGLLQP
ncbi:hypothetical protein LIER_31129 [Lithospermum erythrorhizon]|uniref:Integrase zinc-binding domain-containing protein n=1 Tax=Lithospermum erythrorhizon TaxID=34254 RepID=A0AAV3RSA1_LITER